MIRRHMRKAFVAAAALWLLAFVAALHGQVDAKSVLRAGEARVGADEYLKLTGDKWQRIQKTQDGEIRILGEITLPLENAGRSFSLTPSVAAAASGLFQPYVAIPTGSWPEAVAIGDVNGDGLNDVVMVTSFYFDPANDYMLHVWTQNPDGTLAPRVKYFIGGRPQSVAIGDVNGDGLNDVVVATGTGIGVFTQNAGGTLDPMVFYPTNDSFKVRVADLNNDGLMDIVSIGWGTNTATVFTQNPDGTLAAPVTYPVPHGGYDDLEVGDVNNDGLTDVIVMSGQLYAVPNVSILYQKTDGTLGNLRSLSVGPQVLTHGIGVGDINGDGLNDIVASYGGNRPSSFIASFLQNASGDLDPPTSYASYDIPEPVRVADVNGDLLPDVVVAHGGWNALGVYLQQADGTLAPEELYPIPYASHYNSHGMAVGDINGDGANDVVIADYNHGLVILYGIPPR